MGRPIARQTTAGSGAARSLQLALAAARTAEENRGRDIVVLDMRESTPLFDYFVLATTSSERQARAILEDIKVRAKQEHGIRPLHIEGDAANGWVLLDYTDVVVHLFSRATRDYYDLESLWKDARVVMRMV